ncbi:hypothetical protein [Streptomyces synnematoformans]|uniref:ABC transporter permease n=1 Tax=Streptomyces synnematoformans TaxID=415721 RepID=A0ABP5KAV3_9ACTN
MSAPDTTPAPGYGQFPTALRFSLRNQVRNRMAALLLVGFVPVWFAAMRAMAAGEDKPLHFRLFATGETLVVDAADLTLITAGLNALTMITGFAVFDAVRRTLVFDRRLVFAGYRQSRLVGAKSLSIALVSAAVATYTAVVLLAYWRPGPAGWSAILAGFTVMALTYGAFGLLLGVLVKNDLEGFFLIIMGGLLDTFLQNPLGNPLANEPVLQWLPSFGPTQFAVAGAFDHSALWAHLALGLLWAAGFTAAGLLVFRLRTRRRRGR